MKKNIISTSKAPSAIGPYSQAIEAGGFLFISGQLGIDPETSEFVEGGIKEQTEQVLKNIRNILQIAVYFLENLINTTVFMQDISMFADMNEVYSRYFTKECPARSAIAVKGLPKNALVEIEVIAAK